MDNAIILCRLLHFAAAMLLFGIAVFQWRLAPPSLAASLQLLSARAAAAAIVILLGTTVAWLLLSAGEMGEGWADTRNPETIRAVLFDTAFGRIWQWRLGFAAVLFGLFATNRHTHWPLSAFFAALILGSVGFFGHAAMHTGVLGWLNRTSQSVHVLAAGFWLGSLIPILTSLRTCMVAMLSEDISSALRRFSVIGQIAVGTILATGVANTWLVLGAWPIESSSPYQAVLISKIGLFALMVGLAIINRYVLMAKLLPHSDALRMFRLSVSGEVLLGLGVLGLTSILGTLEPM